MTIEQNALPAATPAGTQEKGWRAWSFALLVSATVALAIVAPFWFLGNASGHDIAFHASNWLDVASQWKQGVLYPHWAEWANGGFGEPRFIFYPPLSWILGAALGLVFGWEASAGAFIVIAQTIAGVSMFALARRTFPRNAALAAAAVYAANPYAQLVVYFRSDFAELLAAAVFPLLILFTEDIADAKDFRSTARPMSLLSIVFAVIWLSNAPAGVLAAYGGVLLLAGMAATHRSWRVLARGGAGMALGFGLSAFFWIPAAHEQQWVRISEALSLGLRPVDNFLYTAIGDPEHNLFNWIASTIAVGMIVLTGLAYLAGMRTRDEDAPRSRVRRELLLLAAASSLLMLRVTLPLWNLLPKLKYLQFPWRWLLPLAVPFAWFAAGVFARKRLRWLAAGGAIIVLIGTGWTLVARAWWDTEDFPALEQALASGAGYEGTDEYDPVGDDRTDLPQNAPRAGLVTLGDAAGADKDARVEIERWAPEEKIIRVHSPAPALLALRLLDYPAWRVKVNGSLVLPGHPDRTMQMILPLAAGESRISARFIRTPDRTAGSAVSLLSLVVATGLFVVGRRNNRI